MFSIQNVVFHIDFEHSLPSSHWECSDADFDSGYKMKSQFWKQMGIFP